MYDFLIIDGKPSSYHNDFRLLDGLHNREVLLPDSQLLFGLHPPLWSSFLEQTCHLLLLSTYLRSFFVLPIDMIISVFVYPFILNIHSSRTICNSIPTTLSPDQQVHFHWNRPALYTLINNLLKPV